MIFFLYKAQGNSTLLQTNFESLKNILEVLLYLMNLPNPHPLGRAVEAGPLPAVPAQQRPESARLPPAGRAAAAEQGGRAGPGGRRGWNAILQHRVRFNMVFIVIIWA